MAGCGKYTYLWTILPTILTLARVIHSTENFTRNGDPEKDFANITTWKCCAVNVTKDEHACSDVSNLKWDRLQFYRLSNAEAQLMRPDVENQTLVFRDSLNCKTDQALQLSVPYREEEKRSLFSFFSQDGHFQYNGYTYSPEEYCINSIAPAVITIVACDYTTYCTTNSLSEVDRKPCLFRCCNYGEVWDISGPKLRCSDSGSNKWQLPQYDLISNDGPVPEGNESEEKPVILTYHPRELIKQCKGTPTFQTPNSQIREDPKLYGKIGERRFKVLTNGTVWLKLRKREWVQLNPGEYCVDGFQNGSRSYNGDNAAFSLIFECKRLESPEKLHTAERERKYSLSFGIIIAVCMVFLLMTEIVYILLWSKHNIHGWTVFSYITCNLIAYLVLGISHFSVALLDREQTYRKIPFLTFCGFLGILSHFSVLCTFSWSTVLSFDLFSTFRTLRPTRNRKSSGLRKFLLYCLFAFMVPTFVLAVGVLLDVTYSTDADSDVITPEYGISVCYVEPRYARFYFVILPIAVLLGINFLLFCNTAYSLYKVKKSTQFARSSSTKREGNNQTFRLILKLLLLNGAVWAVEIISWLVQKDRDEIGILSFILDVVNVMQAVAIFFLFVFKNDILEALQKTYPSLESTVNIAFKMKNLGSTQRSRENVTTTTTDTTYNARGSEKLPMEKL